MSGQTKLFKVPLRPEVLDALADRARAEDRSLAKTAARLIEQGLGKGPDSEGPAPVSPQGPLTRAQAAEHLRLAREQNLVAEGPLAEPVLEPVE